MRLNLDILQNQVFTNIHISGGKTVTYLGNHISLLPISSIFKHLGTKIN